MKTLAFALALVGAAPLHAQPIDPAPQQESRNAPLTLGEWASLARNERQGLVLAAIESLFLAMADNPRQGDLLDQQCLSGLTPKHVSRAMSDIAEERPDLPFVDTFLVLTQCHRADQR